MRRRLGFKYRRRFRGIIKLERIVCDACGGEGCLDCNWSGTMWFAPAVRHSGIERLTEIEEHQVEQRRSERVEEEDRNG